MTDPYERMARFYDLFYSHLSEEVWLDFLDFAFGTHAEEKVRRVLEAGCGTGRVLIPLARRGYDVVGWDRSGPMLRRLREKAEAAGLSIPTVRGDMRELSVEEPVDAVVCLFSTVNYLTEDEDVRRALAAFRDALRPGGILVFDVPSLYRWLQSHDPVSITHHRDGDLVVRREMAHRPDPVTGVWTLSEHMTWDEGAGARTSVEEHLVRIYTPGEIRLFLEGAGFAFTVYGGLEEREPVRPGQQVWRFVFVARRGGLRRSAPPRTPRRPSDGRSSA